MVVSKTDRISYKIVLHILFGYKTFDVHPKIMLYLELCYNEQYYKGVGMFWSEILSDFTGASIKQMFCVMPALNKIVVGSIG